MEYPEFVQVVKSLSIFSDVADDHHLDKIKQDAEKHGKHGKGALRQRNGHAHEDAKTASDANGHH